MLDIFVSTQKQQLQYQTCVTSKTQPETQFEQDAVHTVRCAIGRSGATAAADKREGDGKTPLGEFPIRKIFVRRDRVHLPKLSLPVLEICRNDGWCDDPASPDYNRQVDISSKTFQEAGYSFESLWRVDHLYDLGLIIGHNDSPPSPGFGSCIFVHLMAGDYEATAGCIALSESDLTCLIHALDEQNCPKRPGRLHIK